MSKIYTIGHREGADENDIIFHGTIEQFRREQFFPGPCEHNDIVEWCHDQDYAFTIADAPEDNTHNLKVIGYANRTAMHPVGSYCGFGPPPTVFAQPLVYLGEAQEVIDDLEQQSVRQMFKDVVAEAKRPAAERGDILRGCSIPGDWFITTGRKAGKGWYGHLTDQYIDNLTPAECRQAMALFIATCYRQR